MEKFKKKVTQKLRSVAANMVTRDASEWPPGCFTLVYQPVRPQCRKDNATDKEKDIQLGNKLL